MHTSPFQRDPDTCKAKTIPIPLTEATFQEIHMEHAKAMTRETEEKCKNDETQVQNEYSWTRKMICKLSLLGREIVKSLSYQHFH
ncbi:hypothetical protein HOLleu_16841 [Holothuria leucospilota]|uniref:Uncharacterized protein n=1 Tax=Holothuria leucospilota TaxID=206669 RepID=A0A9Q1C6Q9_HOLLE|nr:hypothetical protein HOLleu_16841 [Holothuria leucospilota]